jgi:hypothetical protein
MRAIFGGYALALVGISEAVTIVRSASAGEILPSISGKDIGDIPNAESIFILVCEEIET